MGLGIREGQLRNPILLLVLSLLSPSLMFGNRVGNGRASCLAQLNAMSVRCTIGELRDGK